MVATAPPPPVNPVWLFAFALLIGLLSGLAHILRESSPLTIRGILAVLLNNALFVIACAALWYAWVGENLYLLVGLITLAALGGLSLFDFLLGILRSGGVNVEIQVTTNSEPPEGKRPKDAPSLKEKKKHPSS